MLTVAVARPRKRPREATILEAYILMEIFFKVGGEKCSRSVCLLFELFVCWSEDVVGWRGVTTVFILLEKQQTA